jgi:hypothetical protein
VPCKIALENSIGKSDWKTPLKFLLESYWKMPLKNASENAIKKQLKIPLEDTIGNCNCKMPL